MSNPVKLDEALSFVRPPDTVAKELRNSIRIDEAGSLFAQASRRAAAMGLDLDSILRRDAERLSAFPTQDCLTPSEATAYVAEEPLEADRVQHARSCEYCTRILDAARPTAEQRERFLDELGSLAARATNAGAVARSSE